MGGCGDGGRLWMLLEWGVVRAHRDEVLWLLGRLATGRMWENRHVGAGAESAQNGTAFGVECEFGGGRGL